MSQIIIKKYPNRRLYDTSISSYITFDDVKKMVEDGVDFVVVDSKNKEDLTKSVLIQIISEMETTGVSLLPLSFLKQMINLYDNKESNVVTKYLEEVMNYFTSNQKNIEDAFANFTKNSDGFPAAQALQELGKQNMKWFEDSLSWFNPFMGVNSNKKKKNDDN